MNEEIKDGELVIQKNTMQMLYGILPEVTCRMVIVPNPKRIFIISGGQILATTENFYWSSDKAAIKDMHLNDVQQMEKEKALYVSEPAGEQLIADLTDALRQMTEEPEENDFPGMVSGILPAQTALKFFSSVCVITSQRSGKNLSSWCEFLRCKKHMALHFQSVTWFIPCERL